MFFAFEICDAIEFVFLELLLLTIVSVQILVDRIEICLESRKFDAHFRHLRHHNLALVLLLRACALGALKKRSVFFLPFVDDLFKLVDRTHLFFEFADARFDDFVLLRILCDFRFERFRHVEGLLCLVLVESAVYAQFADFLVQTLNRIFAIGKLALALFLLGCEKGYVVLDFFKARFVLFDFLFLREQTVCLRSSRTARDFTAARKDFAVECDDFHRLIILFENADCVVDVVDNNRRAEQGLHKSVKLLVVFDKVARKPVAPWLRQYPAMFGSNRARSARRERTERDTSVAFLFQIVDEISRVVFGFDKHVLHRTAERVLDCRFKICGDGDDFRHNSPYFACKHGIVFGILHKTLHRFLIAGIIVFDGLCKLKVCGNDCKF